MTPLPQASDPVLAALADARRRRDQANHDIRVLLAYARELRPRPYRLIDLADAAGMSISGVRIAYTAAEHVEQARHPLNKPLSFDLPAAAAGGTS